MKDLASQPTMSIGPLGIGSNVGERYEIRALLGEGGMGAVYRALDRELDEEIALKVLRPELARTADAVVRFRREVKLARKVTHPNIARTYDLNEHDGLRYITMELITGQSLRDVLPSTLPEILRIAWEVSQGLAAAHTVGVVHRDLKPDNILLTGDRVVLTDFGIARSADPSDVLRTSGSIVGTPAYIAPEQLEGSNVDGRADVYALGVMLYEMISGRLPFEGAEPTAIAVARLLRAPIPLAHVTTGVPKGIASLVMDALARKKEERPDAHTFAARLARLRGGASNEAPAAISLTTEIAAVSRERTLAIAPPDADATTKSLADDLVRAMTDALAKERSVRIARDSADETLETTVRASGDRVRVRLRIKDARGETSWADRVEGALADPFAIEDEVAECVVRVLRTKADRSAPEGPLREKWAHARSLLQRGLPGTREAIVFLEECDREFPNDAWVMSLLASSLIAQGLQTGADDEALFGRAEELALRALDRDRTNGAAFQAIASIRSLKGDVAGALAASKEALQRAPLLAEPHALIGTILAASGRVSEGLQHLELSLRLDPIGIASRATKIGTLALIGDKEGALRELARTEAKNPVLGVIPRLRLFTWWQDKSLAAESAERLRNASTGASWETAIPLMEAYAAGTMGEMIDVLESTMRTLTSPRVVARQRAYMHEVAAELLMLADARPKALAHVEAASQVPGFIDVLWLDRCPNLAPLHESAAFAQARALTADRIARLLG